MRMLQASVMDEDLVYVFCYAVWGGYGIEGTRTPGVGAGGRGGGC